MASPLSSSQTTPSRNPVPSTLTNLRAFVNDPPLPPPARIPARAFAIGYSANVVLDGLLPLALRKKPAREALRSFFALKSLQSGTVLALFSALYKVLLTRLTAIRLHLLSKTRAADDVDDKRLVRLLQSVSLVTFSAALAASSVLAAFPIPSLRRSMALWLGTKAIENLYTHLRSIKSRTVAWIPNWIGGGFFYALSNGQLLWTFLFEPSCFPTSYGRVILARSTSYIPPRPAGLPTSIPWPAPRDIADTIATLSTPTSTSAAYPGFKAPVLSGLTPAKYPTTRHALINPILDYAPAHPAHTRLLCAILHPTEPSCSRNFLSFFAREWQASAKFVAAFTALTQLLSYKKVLKDPETALFRFALAVVQGATVISGSIGTAWGLTCFFQQYLPRTFLPTTRYFLNGFLSSVFILAVPKARRAQLGSYVTRQSLDAAWGVGKRRGWWNGVRQGETVLLALGLATLTSLYETRPEAVESSVRKSIGLLVGKSASADREKQMQLQWKPQVPDEEEKKTQ
ncbi:Transmembrane protein [Kalmanozyma brasiliensis GHG001]|uniref:Transmembrane protein 135 N-terminal domain-containing protein n=1 Tax=Kalmanozyma brasiliensis (strain GHG001) TaxID=1365824 RepID=V5GUX2_KALBG|nr:Transmembrane protein [Kalmanozyma brasiliensis GHG001]EST09712.1 Transmembrane protein [Kalmanozyma brasiliensis GHG001]